MLFFLLNYHKLIVYSFSSQMWGTKEYFAPEVISQAYGPQCDVWALGCVLFEMLSGEMAFPLRAREKEGAFYKRVSGGDYDTEG